MSNYNEIQIQHGDFTITIRITDNNTAEPVTEPEIVWMPTPGPVQERTIIPDPEQSTGESGGASGYTRAETVRGIDKSTGRKFRHPSETHLYLLCMWFNQSTLYLRKGALLALRKSIVRSQKGGVL